jgi:hypothetical protein
MQVKAKDGKTYDVSKAAPGSAHEVRLGDVVIGSFVLLADETRVTVGKPPGSERLLTEIADRFVAQGGAPMGIL